MIPHTGEIKPLADRMSVTTNECVIFEKLIDTHAIASITIPVTGEYKLETWAGGWVKRNLKAGDIIGGVKRLIRSTCPGYHDISAHSYKGRTHE